MNSILQVLCHLPKFKEELAKIQYKIDEEGQPFLLALKDLIAQLTRNHKPSEVLHPGKFKHQLSLRNSIFSGTDQFDALEFFQYMIEFLNEETAMELKEDDGQAPAAENMSEQEFLAKMAAQN